MKKNSHNVLSSDFIGLLFLALLCNMGVGLIIPTMPILMKTYGFSISQMSAIFFAQVSMRFLAANMAGFMLTRIDSYKTLWGALGLYILVMGCFPFASTFPPFIILRSCEGIFEGTAIVSLNNLVIGLSTKDDRSAKMGYFASVFGLGFILGPLLGGFAYEIGQQYCVFWSTGSLALMGFIWLVFKHNLFQGHAPVQAQASHNIFKNYDKTFLTVLPLYSPLVLRRVIFFAISILLPLFLNELYHLPVKSIAFYFTGSAVITTILMPVTGKIMDSFYRSKVIFSLIVMGFCIIGFGLFKSQVSFTILFVAETIAFSFLVPAAMKLFGDVIENNPKRGQILGTGTGIAELFAMFVPITVLPLYKVNALLAWVLLGCLCWFCSIPFWNYKPFAVQCKQTLGFPPS